MLVFGCFFSMKAFADTVLQADMASDQISEEVEEPVVRKFSISRLLTGLGSTCFHLGVAIMSPDDQGKQQAVLGIVGSLLSMAGGIVDEQEKEKLGKGDVAERTRRLEGLVRNCFEEIKANPLYLEKVEKINNDQLRSAPDYSGAKFFDELETSGEAIQELITEIFYALRDAFRSGLAYVGITRSINPQEDTLDDVFKLVQEELFLLLDYVREHGNEATCALGGNS